MSEHNPDNVSRHQGTYIPDQMWGWKFDEPLENLQAPTLENIEYYGTGWKAVDYLIERCRRAENLILTLKNGKTIQSLHNQIVTLEVKNATLQAQLENLKGSSVEPEWWRNK
jgi:hypothetical protein